VPKAGGCYSMAVAPSVSSTGATAEVSGLLPGEKSS
jgi:hypothetical protein